jgi:hypothetical protein
MLYKTDVLVNRFGSKLLDVLNEIRRTNTGNGYITGHSARLAATTVWLDQQIPPQARVLEIGFSDLLHKHITACAASWDYTVFKAESDDSPKVTPSTLRLDRTGQTVSSSRISLNLEEDVFPAEIAEYDAIILCEVIEHMEVDPMHLMSEINRVCAKNGRLYLTTPNSTSARIVYKVINGYHPSFFMQYAKSRSLYRHNFEYTPKLASTLLHAAGFRVDSLEAIDTFEDPLQDGYAMLERIGADQSLRGDNIFIAGTKTGDINDRHPAGIYF